MADIPILLGQIDTFTIGSDDGNGHNRQAGYSIQTAPYPDGYCAVQGGTKVFFKPTKVGRFTVTETGHSQDGTPLTTLIRTYACTMPPPPQATELTQTGPNVSQDDGITTPGDPGSDTVSGVLNSGQ